LPVEAVELGLTRAAGGDVPEVRLVAEATDAGAGAGAEGDAALDGTASASAILRKIKRRKDALETGH
jgi:hypothetical protein